MKKLIWLETGLIFAAVALWGLTGCQDTPEAEILRQKKSAGEAQMAAPDADKTIADQVQAPETYTASFKDEAGQFEVIADAKVVVPDAAGFRLKKVEARDYTQMDLDKVREVLTGNAQMWNRVYREDDPAEGYASDEKVSAGDLGGDSFGESAEDSFGDSAEAAPETYDTELVDGKIEAASDGSGVKIGGKKDSITGLISAQATIDGKNYWVFLDNQRSEDWKWIQLKLTRIYNYVPAYGEGFTSDMKAGLKTLPTDIEKESNQVVSKLGFTDMQCAGGEYFTTGAETWPDGSTTGNVGYGIHYTRVVDGIPVTYTSADGSSSYQEQGQADYSPAWPYETLYLVYDDDGLADFCWRNPYTVTDLSDEYVFMIPFSDISSIFERMMVAQYSYGKDGGLYTKFKIHEIRLGYMRIKEKDNSDAGTLVPVWDFFGSQEMIYETESGEFREVRDGLYDSWLTINAMDGTVIDRNLGY